MEQVSKKTVERNSRKTFMGTVVSTKMNKTVTVSKLIVTII